MTPIVRLATSWDLLGHHSITKEHEVPHRWIEKEKLRLTLLPTDGAGGIVKKR